MKLRLVILTAALTVFSAATFAQPATVTKRQAWTLGSVLSAAAVLAFEKAPKADIDRRFASATRIAMPLGISLPAIPSLTGEKSKDISPLVVYLLRTAGEPVSKKLAAVSPEHAAMFDLAMRTHIALMLYDPAAPDSGGIADVIRSVRGASKLPNGLTDPMLAVIARKGTAAELRAEVVKIHNMAPPFIEVSEFEANGNRFFGEKNYAASAAEFTKAIAVDPEGAEYYFGRGRAYLMLGKNNEAVADYTKMIQLAASDKTAARNLHLAYNNRAAAYLGLGKNDLAIADLTQAIKLKPDYAWAYKVRGGIYQQTGNSAAAKADLAKAESLQPGITK
jgi:tetratricopeptide (TPR) repeat protein